MSPAIWNHIVLLLPDTADTLTCKRDQQLCHPKRSNHFNHWTFLHHRCGTSNASVGCFQVGCEVALARVNVDEVADTDMTGLPAGAVCVEVGDHIGGTADVVVAADAAAEPHPPVHSGQHQYHASRLTTRHERLVHAQLTSVCNKRTAYSFIYLLIYLFDEQSRYTRVVHIQTSS